ncbi:hypothetical protein LPB03_12070 [Polaribacter vadi]|uniref:Uncharacterized protein n=1 Tax=Polaribacter vadi TaxID=1774273 RepID=A0A1B8TTC9_9FLAO|nr:hypothetical protein [Polaribacter vadi]AOW18143.1 hypothetical protein LPB03_12070 [Polaribacter vadi]OBY62872.1 hypothetical protein LPB3_12085 [Polaribacter vadi]
MQSKIDTHEKHKIKLAEAFWDSYPKDTCRQAALRIFVGANFYFILKKKNRQPAKHIGKYSPKRGSSFYANLTNR